MASHQQPSPTVGHPHHQSHPPNHVQPNGHVPLQHQQQQPKSAAQFLTSVNEELWVKLGMLSESFGDVDRAVTLFQRALSQNQWCVPALQGIACILRNKDQFPEAVEYLRTILKVEANNGEVWGSLGHCYLMMDDLQQAYTAYQQALYHLQDPKEPKLWYGIGILYDRYGSLEHAEEAFSQVMRMEPNFEKANEIYFRLGIIYKQQQKFSQSLDCFKYIVQNPPRPLTEEDIWFQIGHVYEQQKDYDNAKVAYKRVLDRDPQHAKVLQQLGWLHHQQSNSFQSQEQAIEYLEKSVASDQNDAQSWYLLGRCYMSQQKYPKAYEAYQQAVYRDGRNPTFWCSIGVLYYQINQYRDALDAYSRAIRLNPNISEVWYDLGTLYESCNNQTADALDAYQRAAELDPTNVHIKARLQLLQSGQPTSGMPNQGAPHPQDVHPNMYQPSGMNGPPGPQWGAPAPSHPPQGAAPPALSTSSEWNRPIAGIRDPPPPGQQLNPELRDGLKPPQHLPPHPASPRYEHGRHYPEPSRQNPPPPRRHTPSPKPQPSSLYGGGPASQQQPPSGGQQQAQPPPPPPPPPPPQQQQQQSQQHPQSQQQQSHPQTPQQQPQQQPQQGQQQQPPQSHQTSQPPPTRITNPNYGPYSSSVPPVNQGIAPPPGQNHPHGPGRMASPPPDVGRTDRVERVDPNRVTSPANSYTQQSYQHPPNPPSSSGGIASGAPPPPSAMAAEQQAARDREDRTPVQPKRLREWEDDSSMNQKTPNDEKRPRLEDSQPRRPSPTQPHRMPSPPRRPPSGAEARRNDDQRRLNDGHYPSDAAHHPPSLPAMMSSQPPPPPPSMSTHGPEPQREERREVHEPASRKMEVDEDYSDGGEDEKRNQPMKSERSSPRNTTSANGLPPAPPAVEQKS